MKQLIKKVRQAHQRLTQSGVSDSTLAQVLEKLESMERFENAMKGPESLSDTLREIAEEAINGTLSATETFNAVGEAYRGYIAALEKRSKVPMSEAEAKIILMDHARGKMHHTYNGLCPDTLEGPDVRDDECQVCRALVTLDAF